MQKLLKSSNELKKLITSFSVLCYFAKATISIFEVVDYSPSGNFVFRNFQSLRDTKLQRTEVSKIHNFEKYKTCKNLPRRISSKMKLAVLALALCLVGLSAADCDVSINIWIGNNGNRRHHNRMSLPDGSTLGDGLTRCSSGGNPFFRFRSSLKKRNGSQQSAETGLPVINEMCGFAADLL